MGYLKIVMKNPLLYTSCVGATDQVALFFVKIRKKAFLFSFLHLVPPMRKINSSVKNFETNR